jgi:hypothetical protein
VIIKTAGSCEIQSIRQRNIIKRTNKPLAMRRRNPLTEGYAKVLMGIGNQQHRSRPQAPSRIIGFGLVCFVKMSNATPDCILAESYPWHQCISSSIRNVADRYSLQIQSAIVYLADFFVREVASFQDVIHYKIIIHLLNSRYK